MPARSRLRSALVLAGFLAAAFTAAALGGIATASSVRDWYPLLDKPAWTPPAWLFGPAWTVLYTAMSVAAWRVWRLADGNRTQAGQRTTLLRLWWVQLTLNAAWSWAFFYFQNPAAGLLVIGTLLLVIGAMQPRMARLDRPAAMLWTPYVLWVVFAAALNLSIWDRN
ncbi:MAG: TspO/MBR family protein [Verrucomicrobiota bacterium]